MFPTSPGGRTVIKICGISTLEMANAAIKAGADAIGIVRVPASPRYVEHTQAIAIAESVVSAAVTPVAVFQLRAADDVDSVMQWPFSWVQLHGDEDEELVAQVARRKRVIRGFRFDPAQVLRWNRCDAVDVLLVDGSSGGRGQSFDYSQLVEMLPELDKPVFLAGGLTHQNVADAMRTVQPHGVDVSSGVESGPGVKDIELIRLFCAAAHSA